MVRPCPFSALKHIGDKTMSDNRTMPQRGFKLSSMTDHEFAQFIRQHELTDKQMLIGNVYSNKSGDSFAVVIFDNAAMTHAIWIKEGYREFKFRKKEKQSTIQNHIEAIISGTITKANIIGIRKVFNADNRRRAGYSVSRTAPTFTGEELRELAAAIHEIAPVVKGEWHESGIKVLTSPRYRKQLSQVLDKIESGIQEFRLIDYWEERGNVYPVYLVETGKGSFRYFNIPWQSGGKGPKLF